MILHHPSPLNSELASSSRTSFQSLALPPNASSRIHKHSLSKPMSWLRRSSSSVTGLPVPRVVPRPSRISEPRAGSSLEQLSLHRCGPLGSGATIVRTPQEALASSLHPPELISEEGDVPLRNSDETESPPDPPPLRSSSPLPALPSIPDEVKEESSASTSVPSPDPIPPQRESGSSSSTANISSSMTTLVTHPQAPSRPIPALPAEADKSLLQPPFEAVLFSTIPDETIDPSKRIVILETCTTTFRTSLRSLVSRPSHLSRYITSLLPPLSEADSLYSNTSDVSLAQPGTRLGIVFRDQLASSVCLPQSPTGIHIFLDRPSAPYTHVLAYLRSLPSTPEQPEMLPRAVQLGPGSPSRLESLLELRDEACYLGLAELEQLCCHEIRRFHRPPVPVPTAGGGTLGGKTASIHSFRMVVEECEPRQEVRLSQHQLSKADIRARVAESAARKSISSSSIDNKDMTVRQRNKERRSIKCEVEPPAGWI